MRLSVYQKSLKKTALFICSITAVAIRSIVAILIVIAETKIVQTDYLGKGDGPGGKNMLGVENIWFHAASVRRNRSYFCR